VRVRSDGTLDPSFAGDGRAEIAAEARRVIPSDIRALPGGAMLAAGTATGGNADFAVARLTPAGAPDETFGNEGMSVVDFDDRDDRLTGLVVFADGGAIAVGTSRPAGAATGAEELAVARLQPDGALDDGFGDGGRARIAVDVVPPDIAIEQAPDEGSLVPPDVTVQGSSTDADALVECTLDSATQPCADPAIFTVPHGPHLLVVRATDPAGNRRELQRRFDVAPDTAPGEGPHPLSRSSSASFMFSSATRAPGGAPAGRFSCRLDAAQVWEPCTSPWTVEGLGDGVHTAEVREEHWIFGRGGSEGPPMGVIRKILEPEPALYRWHTDLRAPLTSVLSAPAHRTQETSASIAFAADEPGSSSECRLDGAEWRPCASPASYAGLAVGTHDVRIRSTDPSGNVESAGARVTWDIIAPGDAALAQRRAAARAGLSVRLAGTRPVPRRGRLRLTIRSTVNALVHVAGTVRVSGARQRARLPSLDARAEAGRPSRVTLRLPRAARSVRRRALVVRLTVTLADPEAELATKRFRLAVR
jgi:uncharacterized delta-60 repeat protein